MTDEAAIADLLDKERLRDMLLVYCRGVDRSDADLMKSLFHDDAIAFGGPAWEFCDHFIPANDVDTTFTVHFLGNVLIELRGDQAFSESYFVTYAGRLDGGTEYIDAFCGRYIDRWERRDGRWGVALRRTVHEWSRADLAGTTPFPIPPSEDGAFFVPVRTRQDIAFER
ncbi:MAG TPA: nuclear transport factor 2 family protein [Pseudolysinimonas sp.]|jgi:hypothetical protein|nr:nuclear transport factor 2 family protein [Pseudolysinimonas sp.]